MPKTQLVDHVLAERRAQRRRAAADGAVQLGGVRQAGKVRLVAAEEVRRQALSLIAVARAQPVRAVRLKSSRAVGTLSMRSDSGCHR